MIDVTKETVARHSDAELVQFLYNTISGLRQQYRKAYESHSPEGLWAMAGDLALMSGILREMNNRNIEKATLAQQRT